VSGSASGQSASAEPPEVLEERCASLPVKDYHNLYQGKKIIKKLNDQQ
jgi:hypothetical protein